MEEYVGDSYDSIAMFLSVHIVYRYRAIMAKRGIPCLDRSVSIYCLCVIGFL